MGLTKSEIALTLAILTVAVALFITERLWVDAVAPLVLISLALAGLVTPAEALSGFTLVMLLVTLLVIPWFWPLFS